METKTEAARTEPPMDGAMRGIVKELLAHGERLALLEKRANRDRLAILGTLEILDQRDPKDLVVIQALRDFLDQ